MNMKLLAGVGIVAFAAGAYVLNQPSSSHDFKLLEQVPADTAIFAGQLEPINYGQYIDLLGDQGLTESDLAELKKYVDASNDPSLKFGGKLMDIFARSFTSSEQMKAKLGVSDSFRSLFYTVGLLPSIRFEAQDPNTFLAHVKEAAEQSDIVENTETRGAVAVSRFPVAVQGQPGLELVIARDGNWVTVTFNTPFNTEQDLNIALGAELPENSLADAKTVDNYIEQFKFDGSSLAFINHVAIIDALTGKADTRLATMITSLLEATNQSQTLASIRTPECQADFSNIADLWPATVSGSYEVKMSAEKAYFDTETVIVSKDSEVLKTLSNIRGFVPSHFSQPNNSMLGVALGLDMAQVAPVLNNLWGQFTEAEFSCGSLVAMQAQLKQSNPMALAMMTGMVSSVKGISATINDFSIEQDPNGMPSLGALDFSVSLSAENPSVLLNTAKGMVPQLASLEIPADGTAVVINGHIPSPVQLPEIKAAIKGQHLVIYSGEQSEKVATNLESSTLQSNGLMAMNIDFELLMTQVVKMIELSGQPLPEELNSFKDQSMKWGLNLDVKESGIAFGSEVELRKL